ncbi:mechanosensitive ion channel [Hymenobacter sp. ASUV-10]|uniref:Mechanosensitive ion channel n=1 Tax=Hymenobacter aranciens TaxID=3063996 RepID=A0ABT9BCZ8_9BACT|nr:mechanosensitive ion channel domain-containing protein [Hymenobacter sp. ASUV-10]MDO7876123.1 mechanosensitive ion channel [Hymenobacter sp. ASUV-10]
MQKREQEIMLKAAGRRLFLFLIVLTGGWFGSMAQTRPVATALDSVQEEDASHRIEGAYLKIGQINADMRRVADTGDTEDELPTVEENLAVVEENLTRFGTVVNVKQLQTFQVLLDDMQDQLKIWRTDLAQSEKGLGQMAGQLKQLGQNLALPTDSTEAALEETMQKLNTKQQRIARRLAKNQNKINALQTRVSNGIILSLELQDEVRSKLRRLGRNGLAAERSALWEAPDTLVQQSEKARELVRQSYAGQRKIVRYYLSENWEHWVWLALIGLSYFGWVFWNYRQVNAAPERAEQPFFYLNPAPVLGALLVMLNLAPLFDLQPPAAYLDLQQLVLILALTAIIWRRWTSDMRLYWLGFFVLFVALALTNAVSGPGPMVRWWMLVLNLGAAGFGWLFWQRIKGHRSLSAFVRPVTLIFVLLNVLAALLNFSGRVAMSKLCSTTAIFGITQIIGLSVFIRLITEAFHLQMQRSRLAGGAGARFNFREIEVELRRVLSVLVAGLWLMVFTSNLGWYDRLFHSLGEFLTRPRLVGSTAFTVGNILLFFGILYASNQLQKYVGYFFGETDDDFSSDFNKRSSRMVAIRLVVLVTGFLLAVAALGLPLDKIALVFGALSVGIGLGLQNVVNNLVSGIILIFERPFHVGDFIEVAGKSGRVKDIGIRSSKLITLAGSEVIVPNGDLLSGHVINWTLSNNHIRVELTLKVDPGADLSAVRQLIEQEIKASTNTLHNSPPEILLNSVNTKVYELKVLFWITNIRQEQMVKSEILAGIHQRFTQQGIELQ